MDNSKLGIVNSTSEQLFKGINAQISSYGFAIVICSEEHECEHPSVENPYHLVYPSDCKSALKVIIEHSGFCVRDARHERRGYYLGLRVCMY